MSNKDFTKKIKIRLCIKKILKKYMKNMEKNVYFIYAFPSDISIQNSNVAKLATDLNLLLFPMAYHFLVLSLNQSLLQLTS